jgi:hypothetical protein
MNNQVKVHLEYLGHYTKPDSQDYRITKLIGAAVLHVITGAFGADCRAGDLISEEQVICIGKTCEVTVTKEAK